MQSSLSKRFAAAAALAVVALGAATAAHAGGDISWSIGIQTPGVYVQPAPVYYPPQPVYSQPALVYYPPQPVYSQPAPAYYPPQPTYVQPRPVYVQPAPVYVQPRPVFVQQPAYGYYYDNGRDWRRAEWERRDWRHHHGRDWDRDGGRN